MQRYPVAPIHCSPKSFITARRSEASGSLILFSEGAGYGKTECHFVVASRSAEGRAQAAREKRSLSDLAREALEDKFKGSEYWQAYHQWEEMVTKGFDLGTKGELTINRDELHIRKPERGW
jgi:hypothetical protein